MLFESLGKRGFFIFYYVKFLDNLLIKVIINELNVKIGRYFLKINLLIFIIDS